VCLPDINCARLNAYALVAGDDRNKYTNVECLLSGLRGVLCFAVFQFVKLSGKALETYFGPLLFSLVCYCLCVVVLCFVSLWF
jgi:hypothetical protein